MLARLCQLKTLLPLLLIVSGCALFGNKKTEVVEQLVDIFPNKWFSINPNHSLLDQNAKPQPHFFFDLEPELVKDNRFISVVVTTPEKSPHAYTLDLNSGQRYYTHSYCSQKDVWNQQTGSFFKPTFTIGIVPRTLDQIGEPQKVIVFGGRKNLQKDMDIRSHQVKLFGAYVEQICPEGNCLGKNNWISRLVLLAVDPEDKKVGHIDNAKDFANMYDWAEVKAHLENLDGRNSMADLSYPGVKIGQIVGLIEAMDYFKKRTIYLSNSETTKIQQGCFSLYDKLWNDVGIERPEDKAVNTVEELKAKLILKKEVKRKDLPVGFGNRFIQFTKKYAKDAATCEKFVYHGNVNKDPDKFWFLTYAGMYYRLHKDGYYFDCGSKTWQKNTLNTEGKPVFVLENEIDRCTTRDIDTAMGYLPNFLNGLKGSGTVYYRFIDYDTHGFGTHRKMYSFVKLKARKYECSNDPNEGIRKEVLTFPEDVTWTTRDVKDIADRMKLIE
jgi:hypothetical protein